MQPTHDFQQARLLASRLGELAALGRTQPAQTRLPVISQLRKRLARQQARDKLKANEFLAGG
jgi:hypothetical protein